MTDEVDSRKQVDELKARWDAYAEDRERAICGMHDELVAILDGEGSFDHFHLDSEPEDEFGYFSYFHIYESYVRIAIKAELLRPDEMKLQRAEIDKLRDDYIARGRKNVEHAQSDLEHAWSLSQLPSGQCEMVTCSECGQVVPEAPLCLHCGRDPREPVWQRLGR